MPRDDRQDDEQWNPTTADLTGTPRTQALMTGTHPRTIRQLLFSMAGSVPDNPTPTDVLKQMTSNMHAQLVEQFLVSATSSVADCLPTGCDPFMKFVQLRSAHSAQRREETHSSASRVQTALTVVRSRTYDTKAGGLVGVGLLTPGVGEPGA